MGKFGLFVYLFLIGRFYSHTLGHKGPSQPVENGSNGGGFPRIFITNVIIV